MKDGKLMAISVKSRKAKGRKLQNLVKKVIYKKWPSLSEEDVVCAIMGEQGIDVKLSKRAREVVGPFAIECKNNERVNFWKAIEQTEYHSTKNSLVPLLIVARNRTNPYAVLPLDYLLELLKQLGEPKSIS